MCALSTSESIWTFYTLQNTIKYNLCGFPPGNKIFWKKKKQRVYGSYFWIGRTIGNIVLLLRFWILNSGMFKTLCEIVRNIVGNGETSVVQIDVERRCEDIVRRVM